MKTKKKKDNLKMMGAKTIEIFIYFLFKFLF